MRIKLRTNMADARGAFQAGAEMIVDDKEGNDLVAGGYAEEVKPKAAAKAPEKQEAKKAGKGDKPAAEAAPGASAKSDAGKSEAQK